jgi:hypothetical protein
MNWPSQLAPFLKDSNHKDRFTCNDEDPDIPLVPKDDLKCQVLQVFADENVSDSFGKISKKGHDEYPLELTSCRRDMYPTTDSARLS